MELIDREKLKTSIRSMVELPNEARAQVIGAISRAKAVDTVTVEEYNALKERYERWKEIADILDTALRQYQRQYGE